MNLRAIRAIYVFEMAAGNICRVVSGERVGTIISTRRRKDLS